MATISANLFRLAGLLVFLLAFLPGTAQDDPTRTTASMDLPNRADREINFANLLFQEGQYLRALPVYDSLHQVYPDKLPIQYLDGICHIYKKTGRTRAIELLREIPRDQFPEIDFYLGRAYHLAYEFDKATVSFERYLSERRPTGSRRTETNRYLRNCVIGKDLMLRATDVKIELLEPPSKQISSQYAPMVTGNEQLMVYTNRGPENVGDLKNDAGRNRPEGDYYEDLFYARFVNGRWSLGEPLSDSINTGGHEASAAISSDGKRLFIYRSDRKFNEDLYESFYSESGWSKPKKLKGEVNSPHWEGSAAITPDGKRLFFSSDRPGGYGGRDLYVAYLKNGRWTDVENLGPPINSQFNEDGPFFHEEDGLQTLYFSSEGHGSMGGYDMFYTAFEDTNWLVPINIGYPVNTTDDDRFYIVSEDGRTGYFSSARASGENRHDIYRLKPGAFERMAKLVVLYGVIKVDDQIAGGVKILFEDAETGQLIGTTQSDTTGQFNYGLLPGNKYKITMNVADAEPHVEYIEVDSANFFVRIDHEFNIYTFAYLKLREQELDPLQLQNEIDLALRLGNQRVADSLSMILKQLQGDNYLLSLQREIDEALRLGNKEVADSLTMVLRRLMGDSFITDLQAEIDEALRLGEQEKADSLTMVLRKLKTYNLDMALQSEIDAALQAGRNRNQGRVEPTPTGKWRVQIGAYRYPGKFNYQFLRGLGEVEIKTYPDGITRYLLGRFDVKADAEAIRDKAIKLGQTDAWVTLRD